MEDEHFDAEATRRVANRAMISAGLALAGAIGGTVAPFPALVVIPFLVIAVAVGISAALTLNHAEAHVLGGVRHVGIVLGSLGAAFALIGIVLHVIALVRP